MTELDKCKSDCKIGTVGYNSPQISEGLNYDTEKADIFSVGALMITVLMRNPFFVDCNYKRDSNFNVLIKQGGFAS